MRISTSQLYQQGVNAMLDGQARLSKTELQLATGRRILAPSDDPSAATRILELDQMISTNHQYQRNADAAETRLNLEETTLEGVGDLLQRVRELAVRANNDTMSADDRAATAAEVRLHLDGLLQLANSKDASGEPLFAGYQTDVEPFSHDGAGNYSYAGDQGQRHLQIGPTRKVSSSDSGSEVFMGMADGNGGMTSAFNILHDFVTDLENNNPSTATLTALDSALDQTLTIRAKIGARRNAIDSQRAVNDSFSLMMEQNRSSLEDLDYAEAVSRFEQQMLTLQASQQSFVKIEGLSLFNYL